MSTSDGAMEFGAKILAGEWDNHLDTIAAAITKRLIDGHATTRWKIEVPDLCTVTEDDLTMGEVAAIEFRTGKSMVALDPASFGADALAIITVRAITLGIADAEDRAKAINMNDYADCYSTYSVSPDPKDTSATA